MEKKTLGKQKIEIEKIERKDHRDVTFTKRRNGVFKNASELTTLCGGEAAVVVFSPGNKPFSFGHPSVEEVTDRFLATIPSTNEPVGDQSSTDEPVGDQTDEPVDESTDELFYTDYHSVAKVNKMNRQVTEELEHLELVKDYGKTLKQMEDGERNNQFLWNLPIKNLEYHQLQQLRVSMEELKTKVYNEADKRQIQALPVSSFADVDPLLPQAYQNNNQVIPDGFSYGVRHSYY